MFRRKFWGTLLLSIPTVVWAPMIQHWFGYQALGGPGASRWISPAFGTVVFIYGGWVFIKGAIGELADRLPGMMTLIALAISVAFGFSLAVTFGFPGTDLWWELATLVAIMVLGHWIEMRSISQAQGALKELAKLLPDTAVRIVSEHSEVVPVSDLRDGDILLIGLKHPCGWPGTRRFERGERVDDHRGVTIGPEDFQERGDRWNRERVRLAPD
jgi:Cu2+-exporting ATPase